jgi:hypothetical protein
MRVGMLHPSRLYLVAITICLTCEMMYCSFRVRVVVPSCFMQLLMYNRECCPGVLCDERKTVAITISLSHADTDHSLVETWKSPNRACLMQALSLRDAGVLNWVASVELDQPPQTQTHTCPWTHTHCPTTSLNIHFSTHHHPRTHFREIHQQEKYTATAIHHGRRPASR